MDQEIRNRETALEQVLRNKRKFNIFEGMDDADIAVVTSCVGFKQFAEGETLIEEHDLSKSIYYILSGECMAMVSGNVVGILTSNTVVGEISGLSKGLRKATVIATKNVTAIELLIDYDNFDRHIVSFSYFYRNLAMSLIKKITESNSNR